MTRPLPLRKQSHQTSARPRRPALAGSGALLGLLAATHTVDDLYQGAVPALLPFLAIERHYTYVGLTGITLAATVLSSAVQPAFGVITDRRRMGWLIAAGLLVAGIGVGLSGLGDSYAITWLAIALSGVGVAAYHPEATRTARGVAGNSTQAMSWFSVGGNLGIALGPVMVTPVLLVAGLRGTPLLVIPAAGMAALLAARRPWRQAQAADQARQSRRAAAGAGEHASGPRRDDWRSFARLTAVVTTRSIAYFGVASLLALFVIRRFHEPTAVGSAALTTFVAAGAVGSLTGGWLADRWRRLATVRLGYICAMPALALLAAAPDVEVAFAAAILSGLALYLPFAVQVTLGQDYLPNRIGTASGVTLGLAISFGGLAAPLFGFLADSYGLAAALAALVALPAASLALAVPLREPRSALA
ncbi:MAG TPA: MFS transporter [Streptosporangiaceae bacterium]|nr:MFS transporter [Streptosporangiaceae bacterium]